VTHKGSLKIDAAGNHREVCYPLFR